MGASGSKVYTLSHPLNTTKHSLSEFKPSWNASKLSTWIDTDPACGQGATNDVDDCWALMMALRSPECALRGISTTFSNTKGDTALQVARQAIEVPNHSLEYRALKNLNLHNPFL